MKHIFGYAILLLITSSGFSKSPVVIPFKLNAGKFQTLEIHRGEDAFFRVEYRLKPGGEVLFSENAEKLWWLGKQPLLMLGASGQPLPESLFNRFSLYLTAILDDGSVLIQDEPIYPLKQLVSVLANPTALADALSASVSMDVTYLAEVANYLAGNLSSVSINASSYHVEGYGEVISSGGVWTGEPIASSSLWSTSGSNLYVQDKFVGIGTDSPQALLHIEPSTGPVEMKISSNEEKATLSVSGRYNSWLNLNKKTAVPSGRCRVIFSEDDTEEADISFRTNCGLEIQSGRTFLLQSDSLRMDWEVDGIIISDDTVSSAAPDALLHLKSKATFNDTVLKIESVENGANLILDGDASEVAEVSFYTDGTREAFAGYDPSADSMYFQNDNGGDIYFLTDDFGIGTSSPSSDLHVYEDSGDAVTTVETDSGTSYVILDATTGNSELQFKTSNVYKGAFGYNSASDYLYWYKGGNVVLKGGNMGIGTLTPAGKLDVNGAIYQRGGQIHADYVFEEDYELESIEEHAHFMWREKHLPAITKATVDEQGQEVVEVGAHRRGIVEELEKAHIYIQQLKRELDALKMSMAKPESESH